jgi:hypothetical protein
MSWSFADLPDWLRMKIQMEYETEALAWLMGKDIRQGKATDAELAGVLYCANLTSPIEHDAGEIYLFVCNNLLRERNQAVPQDIQVTTLTRDQERKTEEYRRIIYTRRGKAETPLSKALKEVFGTTKRPKKYVEEPCSTPSSNSWMETLFQKSIQTNLPL